MRPTRSSATLPTEAASTALLISGSFTTSARRDPSKSSIAMASVVEHCKTATTMPTATSTARHERPIAKATSKSAALRIYTQIPIGLVDPVTCAHDGGRSPAILDKPRKAALH